jgi:PAS domain S-box-containing protein
MRRVSVCEMTPNRDPIEFSHADHSGLFDILASTAVDGIIIIDSDGHIIFSNAACEKLFQYPAQEIAGQNVSVLMPEPYRSEHDSYLDHYKMTGDAHIIGIGREVTGRRKDGSTFPMYLSVGEGRFDRRRVFVGIVHDLTDFHAEAESRRKSDQHLLAVLDSSEDAVLSKDLNGIVTSWNSGAARIFGYSADEMIGSSISILFPPDRLSEEEEILRGIRAGKAVRQASALELAR